MFGLFKKKQKPPTPPAEQAPFWGAQPLDAKAGAAKAGSPDAPADSEAGEGKRWIAVFASISDKREQVRIIEFGKTLATEAESSASKGQLGKAADEYVQIVFEPRRTDAAALKSIAEQTFQQLRTKAKPVLATGDYAGVSFPGAGDENEQLLLQATGSGAGTLAATRIRSKPGGRASVSTVDAPPRTT